MKITHWLPEFEERLQSRLSQQKRAISRGIDFSNEQALTAGSKNIKKVQI